MRKIRADLRDPDIWLTGALLMASPTVSLAGRKRIPTASFL
jgi:hypothetical protein